MPEIKNTFLKSKMNKDLDARIIPSGEYRDGKNISISASEGADVGALENIRGNFNLTNFGLTDDNASSYLQQTEFRMYEYGGGYHLGLYHKAPLIVSHIKTAGSTSARTYKLRWKFLQGEGLVVNETSSPEVSTMTITEIKA